MIEIVVAAYRAAPKSHQQWLEEVVEVAQPHLDRGLGAFGFLIDTRRSLDRWGGPPVLHNVPRGFSAAIRGFLRVGFPRMPRHLIEAAFRRPSPRVAAGSEFAGGIGLTNVPFIEGFARQFGFDDSIGVRCGNPKGLGCFIGAFTPRVFRTETSFRRRWSRVAAHLTAAMRIREAHERSVDASFTRNGRAAHVAPRATAYVAQLREAVINRARARSTRLRAQPDEALELWPALVAGRWSLVDGEGDECHAVWNPHVGSADVAISRLERDVATLLAMGHTNKLIAYEIGLAEGTVSSVVHRLRRKLGAASRTALVSACAQPNERRIADGAAHLEVLSRGEREVVRAAADGFSNAAIAASRGCSVRTAENMLATAYRKLGVRSRAELIARLLS